MRLSTLTFTLTMLLSSSLAYASACDTEDKIHALALNMYHEARGEGSDAMQMVGEVTLNRAENDLFPSTICDVVYQAKTDSSGNPLRGKCQFSWYCDGRSDMPRDRELWSESVQIATGLVDGTADLIGTSATHYHTKRVKPSWARYYVKVGYYGGHVFYEVKDRL
jgi:spore germination cell wall hydrolase CwlJ-like protein